MEFTWKFEWDNVMDLFQMMYDLAEQGDPVAETIMEKTEVWVNAPIKLWGGEPINLSFSANFKDFLSVERDGLAEMYLRMLITRELKNYIIIDYENTKVVINSDSQNIS